MVVVAAVAGGRVLPVGRSSEKHERPSQALSDTVIRINTAEIATRPALMPPPFHRDHHHSSKYRGIGSPAESGSPPCASLHTL